MRNHIREKHAQRRRERAHTHKHREHTQTHTEKGAQHSREQKPLHSLITTAETETGALLP